MEKNVMLWMLASALPIAFACGSDDSGGGPNAALGQQMSELSELGDSFVGQNQATYDGLEEAAGSIGTAFQNLAPAVLPARKQAAGCLPAELAGATFEFDALTSTFVPSDPRGPSEAVQFRLFSDAQTEVGYVNVSCSGVLPGPVNVSLSLNTSDDVEVLDLLASNASVIPPSSFSAALSGTLRTADGQDELPFGQGFSNTLYFDELGRSAYIDFRIGETVTATVSQTVSSDPSFASEQIMISVEDVYDFNPEFICPAAFSYRASMQGTPGNVTGGGVFCARPPLANGYNYFVNCDDGSIDDMVVSPATTACMANIFEGDPTQVSGSVLQDIQEGTDALLGMFNAIISVAEAGAAVGFELAAAQQQ